MNIVNCIGCDIPEQIDDGPLITLGLAGISFTLIGSVDAVEDPQLLEAITEIFPEAEPAVTDEILLVGETPVHPKGNDQV